MFILLNNSYYNELKELVELNNLVPVVLFQITLSDKNSNKKSFDELIKLKNSLNPKYSAIQIKLDKIENQTSGIIDSLKRNFDIVIGLGGLNKINRFFLEQTKIDFLQDPHNSLYMNKTDYIHHFNSNINHVLCNLANEKETGFLFTLNFSKNKKYIYKEIGRINQNIKFARKFKIPTLINFIIEDEEQIKSKFELMAIMSLFDMSSIQKKESLLILENKIKENAFKKSSSYIDRGIEIIN